MKALPREGHSPSTLKHGFKERRLSVSVDTIDTSKAKMQEEQAIASIAIALTQKATAQATSYQPLAEALSD